MKKTLLKAKTPLKSKTVLKTTPKRKRRDPNSIPVLRDKADEVFKRYVRIRDSEFIKGKWVGNCITCNREIVTLDLTGEKPKWFKNSQGGHFVSCGRLILRYEETNVNLQCAWCNAWRDKQAMITAYRKAIVNKYGDATLKWLLREAKKSHNFTKPELLEVIHDSTIELQWYLNHG